MRESVEEEDINTLQEGSQTKLQQPGVDHVLLIREAHPERQSVIKSAGTGLIVSKGGLIHDNVR